MKKVLCFGELLLRLPPAHGGVWLKDNQMPVFIGGAELNVATALSVWGLPVKYFTALPDNIISKDIIAYLEEKKIDTSAIQLSGERIGLYYLQQGADMKSAENVFDRKNSSFATQKTGIINWDEVLDDVSWFHFSAIAPAVSETAAALCAEGLAAAHKKGITISVDLNHRKLLWQYGKEAAEVMTALAKYCTVIMGNVWSANSLLEIPVDDNIHKKGQQLDYLLQATNTAKNIFDKFPNCKWVANTFRFDGNNDKIEYYAALNTVGEQSVSPLFKTESIVERVGSGDCFMAGLIYGIIQQHTLKNIISLAAGSAFCKLQEVGDATNNSIQHIQKIVNRFTND